MIGPYRDLDHLAANEDGIFAGLPFAVQDVVNRQRTGASAPMPDATPEPRVSDDERHVLDQMAHDLETARATIASQAAELAAKEAEIERLTRPREGAPYRVSDEDVISACRSYSPDTMAWRMSDDAWRSRCTERAWMRAYEAAVADKATAEAALKAAREALQEVDGCFEAALAEGWADALASGDIERITDLFNRRIVYARTAAVAALTKEP